MKNIGELRELITPFLNISIDRLSKVEEAVMLVATYELKERIDIPLKTVINEAVEVDKCLGSNDGHRIVNGVLDKTHTSIRPVGDADSNYLLIGGADTYIQDRTFDGLLNIVQHYDRVLSDDEIMQNFNAFKSRYGL